MTTIITLQESGNQQHNIIKLCIKDDTAGLDDFIQLEAADLQILQAFQQRYSNRSDGTDQQVQLKTLGQDIYQWLNQRNWLDAIINSMPSAPWIVEFQLDNFPHSDFQSAFINMPWECLADEQSFLAAKPGLNYSPVRRLGSRQTPATASDDRLSIMFMTASPIGSNSLDYEAEEAAILDASGGILQSQLDLYVEESGNLPQLANELQQIKSCDVLHLSCHGTAGDGNTPPALVLEDAFGQQDHTDAAQLHSALRNHIPRLLVLSACHSADSVNDSLSLSLVQNGMPAVIGMGGAVSDHDASRFSASLYHNLTESATLEQAVGQARFDLLNNEQAANHWHMPRLLLRANGGGVLSNGNQSRSGHQIAQAQKVFFGAKENPVASQDEFVGRRRQIQHCLSAWRNGQHAVLIQGMGRQGKSSTALRLASRMHQHQLVVIYQHYDANYILKQIKQHANQRQVTEIIDSYDVNNNPQALADCLTELLQSPYQHANQDNKALLLVIDDLEQILQPGAGKHQVIGLQQQQTLQAVIRSFDLADTDSRLLITSRYAFSLPDQNKDLADTLHIEHMPPMSRVESRKQARRRTRQQQISALQWSLEQQCISTAAGNPGLQDWLFGLAFDSAEHCQQVIQQMQAYQQSGKSADNEALNDWLENLLLRELIALLDKGQLALLEALTLFEIPVPETTVQTLQETLAADDSALSRLLALGLCDAYAQGAEHDYMIHPLVRPNIKQPDQTSKQILIKRILPNLSQHWSTQSSYQQDLQLLKLALSIEQGDIIVGSVAKALYYLFQQLNQYDKAQSLAIQSLDIIQQQSLKADSQALHRIAQVLATTADEIDRASSCYRMALQQAELNALDEMSVCSIRLNYAALLKQQGAIEDALEQLELAQQGFKQLNAIRDSAIAMGQIARIRVSKGDVEGALALHEEELIVYESLGDQRSRAVTLGDIARIRVSKGDLDAALTLQIERLEVARSMGDQDNIGASLWDLAQIELQQGNFDSAIQRLAEAWSIFNHTGRVDGLAAVGNLFGQLLCSIEQFDEARSVLLRTREALTVLGRVDEIGKIDELLERC